MQGRVLRTALAVACLAAPATQAAAKAKEEALPARVTVENGCAEALDLKVGALAVKAEASGSTGPHIVPSDAPEGVHELKLGDAPLARLTFEPGGQYVVRLADCRAGAADVYTRAEGLRPPSPHAAARVRFRARENRALEYKLGASGRFLPLSVALTRAQEAVAGEGEFTLRLRAAAKGPVMKILNKKLKLEPGHQYLVEAYVVGGEVLFSAEDEGLVRAD